MADEQQISPQTKGQAAESATIPAPAADKHYFWGTGRRKTAVARVRIRAGDGKFEVNKRPLDKYFTQEKDRLWALGPLEAVGMKDRWDVFVNVRGGGFAGQAGAIRMGLARALRLADDALAGPLKSGGFLTRDARMKERKKYGQKGARKRFQFSKR